MLLKARTADACGRATRRESILHPGCKHYVIKPEKIMNRLLPLAAALIVTAAAAQAADRPTRFWNLTHATVQEFQLAPAGTTAWGPDQCKNDKDGAVDFDERLAITGVESGRYDARLKDASGRVCFARNIAIEAGKVFSIDEKALVDCTK
jgi:hypothetical protein